MADITVFGTTITEVQQTEIWTGLRRRFPKGGFTYVAVQGAVMRLGFNGHVAYRAADRMLQMMRRSGKIRYERPKWYWA